MIEDDDFNLTFRPCTFRIMPVPSPVAVSANRRDDYLLIKFLSPMGYVSLGTKILFNSNPKTKLKDTFLVWNPENLTSDIADTQIKKCTRQWNKLDYYGNLISEPFIADDLTSTAVDSAQSSSSTNIAVQRDALSCVMQYNSRTKDLKENDRVVLGGLRYAARGVINHARTITDDPDSVKLLAFTLERDNQDHANDDLINDIVDGKDFNWTIVLSVDSITVIEGDSGTLTATSLRIGIPPKQPFTYIWESSDTEIVTIDEFGAFTAHMIGTATITCRLRENPNIQTTAIIQVKEAALDNFVLTFDPAPLEKLRMYQSMTLECFVKNNGVKTAIPVSFTFSGAGVQCYSVSEAKGNSVKISCNAAAMNVLTVTASAKVLGNDMTTSAQIKLLGI